MPPAPVFEQQDGSRLFALSTTAQSGVPGFWAGYCAAPGSGLAGTMSTAQVWQDTGGSYLFLGRTPTDWDAFLSDFDALRPNLAPPDRLRFLWIENPDAPMVQWRLTAMQARAEGAGASIAWRTLRATGFSLGHYGIQIAGLGALNQIPDAQGGGVGFAGGGRFHGPNGDAAFVADTLVLPFDGVGVARFAGNVTVPAVTAAQEEASLWHRFAVGLCYAAPPLALDEAATPQQMAAQGATRLLFQRLFDGQGTAITTTLAFDLLNPLIGARSHLSLAPTIAAGAVALPSYLRTTLGYGIGLTPLAAAGDWPEARFVFGAAPVQGSDQAAGAVYHLSPEGAFRLTVTPPDRGSAGPYHVLCGLSGLEYIALTGADSHQIVFAGGCPAFAVPADDGGANAPTVANALSDAATTSHAAILPYGGADDAVYFAQPQQAPIFSGKTHVADRFLDFNPMPAATLTPPADSPPPVFPLGVYAGLRTTDAPLATALENASLAPYRHYRIDTDYGQSAQAAAATEGALGPTRRVRAATDPSGVTPQGLVVELTPDYADFDGVSIGHMPGTEYPRLDFTVVTGDFKTALQSNQLFFVAANVDVLMQATSVRYEFDQTDENTALLKVKGVPDSIITAVYGDLAGQPQPFETEAAFVACIGASATPQYLPIYLAMAGLLQAQMDGWTFQLSPRAWRPWRDRLHVGGAPDLLERLGNTPTVMIAKFCNRTLADLAADTSSWVWPEVAVAPTRNGTLADTQRLILDIFDEAAAQPASLPYRRFLTDVVNDPAWNGFLFLNAPVDIAELPTDLSFLTAGIDTGRFYAHHLGLSQTPFVVTDGAPVLQNTAAFGLIDYVDEVDLYTETTVPFDFKTLQLRARFANSALADFSAKAELLVNQLFADQLTKAQPEHGNNLVLDGGYQRVGGVPVYSFVLEGQNTYAPRASVLSAIDIATVGLQTRSASDTSAEIVTDFTLAGTLAFSAPQAFDLYSFGTEVGADGARSDTGQGLRFSGLIVSMRFSLADPEASKVFTVDEGNLGFDLANSVTRPQSLVSHFPLTLQGLIAVQATAEDDGAGTQQAGASPEDLGFTSVAAPLDQTPLAAPWYGLHFSLDLGTLGALLGSVGIGVDVLAAWQPGALERDPIPPQYIGVRLDTGPAEGVHLPLQGVLRLGFRSFQFLTYVEEENLQQEQVYLLRLHRFDLSVLGLLNFPPGTNDVVLFGNPDQSGRGKLGWYAAYAADARDDAAVRARPGRKRLAAPADRLAQAETPPPVTGAPPRRAETLRRVRAARSGRRGAPRGDGGRSDA